MIGIENSFGNRKRVNDWLSSGDKEDDRYIEKQLRYAKSILNKEMTK